MSYRKRGEGLGRNYHARGVNGSARAGVRARARAMAVAWQGERALLLWRNGPVRGARQRACPRLHQTGVRASRPRIDCSHCFQPFNIWVRTVLRTDAAFTQTRSRS
jgi:hypothetical protein